MNTPEAFAKAKAGFMMRRRNWPSGKVLVHDFLPGESFTIRNSLGWMADVDEDSAPYKEDWEEVKTVL